ncbi:hypothetical protein AAMO2058_000537500 [Amorphochlora amoebiformis]
MEIHIVPPAGDCKARIISRIVVAIDNSAQRFELLRWTYQHVFSAGDQVTLVHVFEFTPLNLPRGGGLIVSGGGGYSTVNKRMHDTAVQNSSNLLKHAAKYCETIGFKPFALKALPGYPTSTLKQALLDYCTSADPDFVVCGSRGLGLTARAILGSVSDYLAHNCSCPVLIYKSKAKKTAPKTSK